MDKYLKLLTEYISTTLLYAEVVSHKKVSICLCNPENSEFYVNIQSLMLPYIDYEL